MENNNIKGVFRMCKIVYYPQKKELPKELREKVYGVARDYVDVLYEALEYFVADEYDYQTIDEVNQLVIKVYAEGLNYVVDEYEE